MPLTVTDIKQSALTLKLRRNISMAIGLCDPVQKQKSAKQITSNHSRVGLTVSLFVLPRISNPEEHK